jgi:hypothetical protein
LISDSLVNLSGGDRDSVGLFQQRPSQGWGTPEQLHTPTYAATAFYTRLLAVPGWQGMELTGAAQAVQRSAYPGAYAQWERSATVIVAALLGQHAPGCRPQATEPSNPKAQTAVHAALSQLGVPYSFAGGNRHGPTLGVCQPGHRRVERLPHRRLRLLRPHALRLGQRRGHRPARHRRDVERPRVRPPHFDELLRAETVRLLNDPSLSGRDRQAALAAAEKNLHLGRAFATYESAADRAERAVADLGGDADEASRDAVRARVLAEGDRQAVAAYELTFTGEGRSACSPPSAERRSGDR